MYSKSVFILLALILFSCSERKFNKLNTNLESLKEKVSETQDHRATMLFSDYERLLNALDSTKFKVVTIDELNRTKNDEKVMVGMRHDVDNHPFKALRMAEMEAAHGFNATYYILATSVYWGEYNDGTYRRYESMGPVYQELQNLGAEIGIHNDLLAIMIHHKLEPFAFNMQELAYYNSLDINIIGTVAHGSSIASAVLPNFNIFSDFAQTDSVEYQGVKYPIGEHSMANFGFEYEANFVDHDYYFSESGGTWGNTSGIDGLIEALQNSKVGERFQILTHPCWWE